MDTYFGVTDSEAAAPGSNLSEFDASSGFRSVGIAARANYELTENTTLHLQGGWDRLVGDAADSPIAKAGSENQFNIGTGISYKFAFDIFQ
jgi:outer membrane protein